MLTRSEFNKWFADYKDRWPSIGDYVAKQDVPEKVLDTWHQSMAAFSLADLEAVTAGILAGDFEPIEPIKFGQWGSEVRRLARHVFSARRDQEHKREERKATKAKPFNPLVAGSMTDMYHACCAVYELLTAPDEDVVMAAITLADDHTAYERDRSLLALEGAGLTWEQVLEVAGRLKRTGGRPMVPSAKEVESEVV